MPQVGPDWEPSGWWAGDVADDGVPYGTAGATGWWHHTDVDRLLQKKQAAHWLKKLDFDQKTPILTNRCRSPPTSIRGILYLSGIVSTRQTGWADQIAIPSYFEKRDVGQRQTSSVLGVNGYPCSDTNFYVRRGSNQSQNTHTHEHRVYVVPQNRVLHGGIRAIFR